MTRLDFIAPPLRRRGLTLKEIEANKALARHWREANPDFFATEPQTLPLRSGGRAKGSLS